MWRRRTSPAWLGAIEAGIGGSEEGAAAVVEDGGGSVAVVEQFGGDGLLSAEVVADLAWRGHAQSGNRPGQLPQLERIVANWQPDIVVHDGTDWQSSISKSDG